MKVEVVATVVLLVTALVIALKFRNVFQVSEGFVGLLYHEGEYVETLPAGRSTRWGLHYALQPVDFHKAALTIAGQEVITSDGGGLKVSLVVSYRMIDPVKALHDTQSWQNDVYHAAQLALRRSIGTIPVESLLQQRLDLGPQLLASVQPDAAKIGIHVLAVEVKDVMFPADLKRAFAEVLKARQESQAALERARGETAALRHLANAARVLDGNPALMNLRLVQSLTAAQHGGSTLVVGVPGGFVPLKTKRKDNKSQEDDS
jgi:regulator of protease activity HflC (stomatin/prohibitin superfamily)